MLFSHPARALDNHPCSLDELKHGSLHDTSSGFIWNLVLAIPFSTHFHGSFPCVICTWISVHKYLSTEWMNVPLRRGRELFYEHELGLTHLFASHNTWYTVNFTKLRSVYIHNPCETFHHERWLDWLPGTKPLSKSTGAPLESSKFKMPGSLRNLYLWMVMVNIWVLAVGQAVSIKTHLLGTSLRLSLRSISPRVGKLGFQPWLDSRPCS